MDTATDRVAVRMDPDLKQQIKEAAEAEHRTISAYVVLACREREAAQSLAAGVRSFLASLPFMAPEMIDTQARVKLLEPLARFSRDTTESAT
jgi:hypothetical protein